jgi:hypothetical protein
MTTLVSARVQVTDGPPPRDRGRADLIEPSELHGSLMSVAPPTPWLTPFRLCFGSEDPKRPTPVHGAGMVQ